MSKEYKAGDRALTKVGRNLVEVRVKGKTENGWTVETRSGKTLTVKNLEPLQGETATSAGKASSPAKAKTAKPAKAAAPKPSAPKEKATADKGDAPRKGLSLLSAAAAVLERSDEPLSVKAIIAKAKESGLWTPGSGKTPEQTLYSAIIREMRDKGDTARFRKEGRGLFASAR